MSSLVTVIIGQVGDGFAPVANHCKGTVYIVSQGRLQVKNVAALKQRGLLVNHLNANFKNLGQLSKKAGNMRNDIERIYGGIDVLINTATYSCDFNPNISVHIQARTAAYFNCLAVMTICAKLFPILRNGSTVIYCTLKYNYNHIIPHTLQHRFEDSKLTYNKIKLWMHLYIKATKQGSYEAKWGSSPYAVSRAGFIAMKNLHRNFLNIKGKHLISEKSILTLKTGDKPKHSQGIKIFCDFGINVSLDPYRLHGQTRIVSVANGPFFIDNFSGITDFEIQQGVTVQHNLETMISNQNGGTGSEFKKTNIPANTRKRARHDSTETQDIIKKLCTNSLCTTNQSNWTSSQAHLNIAISTKTKRDLTQEEANYIKDEIHKTILATFAQPENANKICPVFSKNPCYSEGVLKLWCDDDETLTWLTDIISKLHLPREGCNLIVIDQRDIPGKVKVALFVPDYDGDLEFLQKILIAQNRWCDMKLWSLCSFERTTTHDPSGIFLKLSIPLDDVPKIMLRRRQIHFSIGEITLRFITSTGFSNEPEAINRAGETNGAMVPIDRHVIDHRSNYSFPCLSDALQCLDEFMPIVPTIQNIWGESSEM